MRINHCADVDWAETKFNESEMLQRLSCVLSKKQLRCVIGIVAVTTSLSNDTMKEATTDE